MRILSSFGTELQPPGGADVYIEGVQGMNTLYTRGKNDELKRDKSPPSFPESGGARMSTSRQCDGMADLTNPQGAKP